MKCKRNKWDCEKGVGGRWFQKGKFEFEMKLKIIERYHSVELMVPLPVLKRWKELGKGRPSC